MALTWAGIPPLSITPPSAAVAVTLSQNDATGAASIASTEVDYYAFTATASGAYTLSATTPASNLDTVLGLFSASGQRLAYNDDISRTNLDSSITVTLTAGTRYYIGITNYSSRTRGSYTWTIDGPAATLPDDAYENNDTLATAYNLGTLTEARTVSSLALADNADWFKFTTTATGTTASSVAISFQNAQGNLDLALFNAAGTQIGVSQGTGNSETISLNGLAAGTYYVRITGANGAFNPSYSLTITPPTSATPPSTVTPFPDVPYFGGANDWAVNSINAPEAWAKGYTGSGVIVAVVDTGVDLNHSELANQIWVNTDEIPGNGIDDDHDGYIDDVNGWDFVSNDNTPDDLNGHGTHVAGIIAAANNGVGSTGVAYGATIMPVRVLDSSGSGTESAVAAGIRYAAENGANIINLSLGGSFSSVIQSAIQFAQSLNVLVVVAAGNESASSPSYPARFSATLSNVISVGAYSSSNSIASFSNHVGSSGAVQVDAPGVSIYSTYLNGTYATLSGTSMATPEVSGLAALILSANHALTAAQVRDIIVNGANHVISGSDSRGGVNAALSVAMAAAGVTGSNVTGSSYTLRLANGSTATGALRFTMLSLDSADLAPALSSRGNGFDDVTQTPVDPAPARRIERAASEAFALGNRAVDEALRSFGFASIHATDDATDHFSAPSDASEASVAIDHFFGELPIGDFWQWEEALSA